MNRLQLVNALSLQASIAGNGVSTTIDQTGESARLVNWIDQAYEDVQNEYFDWRFLRATGSFNTQTITNIIQPASDLNIWDRERIFNDEGMQMSVQSYDYYDGQIDVTTLGKPNEFVVNADNTLTAIAYPDAIYAYTYDYFKAPEVMTVDSDTPNFPAQFHRVIVGRALIYYGNYESAGEMIMQGKEIYSTLLNRLSANQASGERRYYGLSDASDIVVVPQ